MITWVFVMLAVAAATHGVVIEPCLFETCKCDLRTGNASMTIECLNDDKSQATPNYFPKRTAATFDGLIKDMAILNYDFKLIPDEAFSGLAIDLLILSNNSLTRLTKNTFNGIKRLESLHVSDESNFEAIEAGAFDLLINSTKYLELSSLKIDNSKLASFSTELGKLKNVGSLHLEGNQITIIGPDQFKGMSALSYLRINDQLTTVDANAFRSNPGVSVMIASNNKLTNVKEIFTALKSVDFMNFLYLERNLITSLDTDNVLPSLMYFSLAHNQIESFNNQSLVGTNRITDLDLSYNKLNYIDDARIRQITSLSRLQLSNNYLSKCPTIFTILNLITLDMSSQNGKLKSIDDYAFERYFPPYSLLSLNLDGNDIDTFGKQAFCSRYYVPSRISEVTFSYNTMKALPKCVLKQLSLNSTQAVTKIKISNPTVPTPDLSEICNCDLVSFAKIYRFNITGACDSVFAGLNCNSDAFKDPCVNQPDYECVASLTTTTTTTTTTSRTTTTTSGSQTVRSLLSLTYVWVITLAFYAF